MRKPFCSRSLASSLNLTNPVLAPIGGREPRVAATGPFSSTRKRGWGPTPHPGPPTFATRRRDEALWRSRKATERQAPSRGEGDGGRVQPSPPAGEGGA